MGSWFTVGSTSGTESSAFYTSLSIPLTSREPVRLHEVRLDARGVGQHYLDLDGSQISSVQSTGVGVVAFHVEGVLVTQGAAHVLRIRMATPTKVAFVSAPSISFGPFVASRPPELAAGYSVPLEIVYDDPREYIAWADVTNPTGSQVGSTVGTQIAAGSSSGLFWYLEKAGIKVGGETQPTTGRIWPR